ncbi:hypothetical protein MNB_SUP05-5-831 [hydrothermal vent metagenome]|uniref:Exostosin GT47 domain-containing protein n=1 Tax=hydrothermal vent metagenome TaxID=652676 RepID=A0A1W1CNW3_9ZZZZ
MKVNILTKGLRSYNGIAFLTPLILNKKQLKKIGVEINFFTRISSKLTQCDVLILESKFFVGYWQNTDKLFTLLQSLKKQNKLYFFDIGDSSSSWVLGVLPFVDRLYKSYILKDKSLYMKSMYGGRIWTDYYHKNFNINDDNENDIPKFYADEKDLDKIHLSYGATLGNYSLDSVFWQNNLQAKLAKRLWFFRNLSVQKVKSSAFVKQQKENNLSARMSVNGYSQTVGFMRKKTSEIIKKFNAPTTFLNRSQYLSELANSKIVISPFGWGEMNYKDYEVAMAGSILLKPDFSHLETWPHIFNDTTVVQYDWDFSNLEDKIDEIINNYDNFIDYGVRLQEKYKHFVGTDEGQNEFCTYFKKILTD